VTDFTGGTGDDDSSAAAGADVVVADVDGDAGRRTAGDLSGQGDHRGIETDVADRDDVEVVVAETIDAYGAIDVFMNNAGTIQFPHVPTVEQDVDEWQRNVDVHLRGTYLCSKAVGPAMLERGSGAIVSVSSITSFAAIPGHTAYDPAKSAINSLTRALAVEWADRGVRVNTVAPGNVMTEWLADRIEAGDIDPDPRLERTPMHKWITPADVGDAVHFLAGEDAQMVTGVVLPVDGGWTAYGWV